MTDGHNGSTNGHRVATVKIEIHTMVHSWAAFANGVGAAREGCKCDSAAEARLAQVVRRAAAGVALGLPPGSELRHRNAGR